VASKPSDDPRILALFDSYVHGSLSRRQFIDRIAAVAAAGVSASAILASLSPNYALAEQVSPDDKSISVAYKKYASPKGAGEMRGYFARPAIHEHKLPGVVVVHENRGLNPYIEDVARRLAAAGFIAFAPDALWPLGGYPGDDDTGRTMQTKRDDDEMVEDFVAAVNYLQQHPDCTAKVGAVGFCFGGSMVMRLAVRLPDLNACVPFYGRHPAPEEAAAIQAPLLLHHAGLDERVNASWPAFKQALEAAGSDYVEYNYAGVNHGFHNDTTPRYDKTAAELAWQRTLRHFTEHLWTGLPAS
jgi:carboxymethylenebutenolidase